MIHYIKGDLLSADAEALVNTVNTVGVMGKGIALQFKDQFPNNFNIYLSACKRNEVVPGRMLVVEEASMSGNKIIINFPTKKDWRHKSSYAYVDDGLKDLVSIIKERAIRSIAIPPLGCGNGGLDWGKVKPLMEKHLEGLEGVEISIFEPNDAIKEILKRQDSSKEVKLTPARALLLYAMFYYDSSGENTSLFVANKLAYLLQRLGEPSFQKLRFEASHYGPFCIQVGHLVHVLNGKYLKGTEQMTLAPFEPIELQYDKMNEVSLYVKKELKHEQIERLKKLIALIDGFQTALSLEILASVDFVKKGNPNMSKESVVEAIQNWSNRKNDLFKERYISIAYDHLAQYAHAFEFGAS